MTIAPIGGLANALPAFRPQATDTAATGSATFGSQISQALEELDRMHSVADTAASQAATGELESINDYLVAATEAQLATQVTVAVRNRAVEAFNDIMRMQV